MTTKNITEDEYSVDFNISEKYIAFSSELLRISLLIIGGLGTLIIKGEDTTLFNEPLFIIISLMLFVVAASTALSHRYYATDCLSWYIAWLRAEKNEDAARAATERKGFYRLLKLSRFSLIICEVSFALGILFFLISILKMFCCF